MMSPVRITFSAIIFILIILMVTSLVHAQTTGPQEILNQYVADLQKNPNDYALREKIIKHTQTMKPAPALPEEARRYFIEGNAMLKAVKEQKGYGLALDAYRQCLLAAPWWAEAYYNYSVALDLANRFDEAVNVLKLYITTNPGEAESRKAQDKIYEIGAKKKLAAQEKEESSPQAIAAREQKKSDDWLKKLDGRRYRESRGGSGELEVRGKFIVLSAPGVSLGPWEIRGRSASTPRVMQRPPLPVQTTFIISEDGDRVIEHRDFSDGNALEFVWVWQR